MASTVHGGAKVAEKEFVILPELLMRQLLKLDSIEAEGEAKVQRRTEVLFNFPFIFISVFSQKIRTFYSMIGRKKAFPTGMPLKV